MTQIVRLGFKGPQTFAPLLELDALSNEAHSVVDRGKRIRKVLEVEPNSLHEADIWVAELQALKPSEQYVTELVTQIAAGLRPATSDQVQEQLALLVGAFPSSNAPDPMVYSCMMFNEVTAAKPSVIALTAACTELRRTRQWPPSTADVLKAIREQEMGWQDRLRCASVIVDDHAQSLSKLLERRAWLARPDAEKEAERKERLTRMESLMRLLRAGPVKRGRKRK